MSVFDDACPKRELQDLTHFLTRIDSRPLRRFTLLVEGQSINEGLSFSIRMSLSSNFLKATPLQ